MGKTPSQREAAALIQAEKEQAPALAKLKELCDKGSQSACIDYAQAQANDRAMWQEIRADARQESAQGAAHAREERRVREEKMERELELPRLHTTNCFNLGTTVSCTGN